MGRGIELIQILGSSSVAIGFAFRNILQNFLAGILILVRSFALSDGCLRKNRC
jgi:small-conductance mechanosensitive channel